MLLAWIIFIGISTKRAIYVLFASIHVFILLFLFLWTSVVSGSCRRRSAAEDSGCSSLGTHRPGATPTPIPTTTPTTRTASTAPRYKKLKLKQPVPDGGGGDDAQVFFYPAEYVSGLVKVDGKELVDYAWVTREELQEYFDPELFSFVRDMLPG